MDQQYIKEHQLVERFVLNQLSGRELDEFLVYQMMHPEIQKAIEEERARMKSVRALQRDGMNGSATNWQWWWMGGTALIILLAAWFFFNQNDSSVQPPVDSVEAPKEKMPIQEETPAVEERKANNTENKPATQNKHKTDQKKKIAPTISRPIAQRNPADFAPLDYWEMLSELSTMRDPTYNFVVNSPSNNQVFELKDEKTIIDFNGTLNAVSLPENDIFKIWIYSNKKADLMAGLPVFEAPLNFTKDSDDFIFALNAELDVKPGLYYFYVALVSVENPLAGGKFTVEN